jgi:hypothetical protein
LLVSEPVKLARAYKALQAVQLASRIRVEGLQWTAAASSIDAFRDSLSLGLVKRLDVLLGLIAMLLWSRLSVWFGFVCPLFVL